MGRHLAFALAALAVVGCKRHPVVSADAGIADAGIPEASVAAADASRRFGSDYPLAQFNAGTAISLGGNPPTCIGGCTINNIAPGGGGVTSVSGGTGINASPTTGAVVVSLQTPVTVPNGGTGDTSLTAHGVVVAEGTSPFVSVAAGGAGTPLVNLGGSADPTFQLLSTAGGGTGINTSGGAGNVLRSTGTIWASGSAPVGGVLSNTTSTAIGSSLGVENSFNIHSPGTKVLVLSNCEFLNTAGSGAATPSMCVSSNGTTCDVSALHHCTAFPGDYCDISSFGTISATGTVTVYLLNAATPGGTVNTSCDLMALQGMTPN